MTKRLIPNADREFQTKAYSFARAIAPDPERFNLTPADAQEMSVVAERFKDTLNKARCGGGRSQVATRAKDQARKECEQVYRRCVRKIQLNENLDAATLVLVGLKPAKEKRQARTCPQEPPRLRFLRALHEGGATPVHELEFRSLEGWGLKRPAGAVRLELFVDLIPPDEAVPTHPGANHASRPWYLRSYTRSPIRLIPPMARVPMRVVYWGRWADSVGNVGPFSATAAAWIEGGTHGYLPGGTAWDMRKPVPVLEEAGAPGPAGRETTYVVAVVEAQYQSLHSAAALLESARTPRSLPEAPPEPCQIEGPPEESAQAEAA